MKFLLFVIFSSALANNPEHIRERRIVEPTLPPKACRSYNPKDQLLDFTDYKGQNVGREFQKSGPTMKISVSSYPEHKKLVQDLYENLKDEVISAKLQDTPNQMLAMFSKEKREKLEARGTQLPQLIISIDLTKQIAAGFEEAWRKAYIEKEIQRQEGVEAAVSGAFCILKPLVRGIAERRSHGIAEQRFREKAPGLVHQGVWDQVNKETKKEGDAMLKDLQSKKIDTKNVRIQFKWDPDVERNYAQHLSTPGWAPYVGIVLPNGKYFKHWHGEDIKAKSIQESIDFVSNHSPLDDSDCDGVPDYKDLCPNTPEKATVATSGPKIGCAEQDELAVPTTRRFAHLQTRSFLNLTEFPGIPNVARGEPYNYVIFENNGKPLAYSVYPHEGKLGFWDPDKKEYSNLEQEQLVDMAKLVNLRLITEKHESSPEVTAAYLSSFQDALNTSKSPTEKSILRETIQRLNEYSPSKGSSSAE